jgi:hypothetical protein
MLEIFDDQGKKILIARQARLGLLHMPIAELSVHSAAINVNLYRRVTRCSRAV